MQCNSMWQRGCLSASSAVPVRKGELTVGLVWSAAILLTSREHVAGVALESMMGQSRETINSSGGETWRAKVFSQWTHT